VTSARIAVATARHDRAMALVVRVTVRATRDTPRSKPIGVERRADPATATDDQLDVKSNAG
jgi:hypothetical protein